jgi:hypothetical protein
VLALFLNPFHHGDDESSVEMDAESYFATLRKSWRRSMHVMYRNDQMRTMSTSHLRHLARLARVMDIKFELCAPPYRQYF